MTDETYLSLNEASVQSRCKEGRLKRLAEQGKLPGARWVEELGRWAIPESALTHIVRWPLVPLCVGEKLYLPVGHFAKRRGVTRQRIYQLIGDGKLAVRRFDGKTYISEEYL